MKTTKLSFNLNCCISSCCFNDGFNYEINNNKIKITNGKITKHLTIPSDYEWGQLHRDDGPAVETNTDYIHTFIYYLNGGIFNKINFAKETDHLICNYCYQFCKQQCF